MLTKKLTTAGSVVRDPACLTFYAPFHFLAFSLWLVCGFGSSFGRGIHRRVAIVCGPEISGTG